MLGTGAFDVVLPVLDEALALPVVLADLPPQAIPLVVDNGSTDGSAAIARELGARVVMEPRRGFGAACSDRPACRDERSGLFHGLRRLVSWC